MKRLLAAPDVSHPLGVRNRALLEVLYATGVRVGELERVACQDLDLYEGTMHLRFTKGGQPHVVPLGQNAPHWLRRYVDEVRSSSSGTVP
jgi:integrase/recombinase XerD